LDQGQRVWIYFQRWGCGPWEEIYNFSETEFFPADFDILNYYTIRCSPFSRMVLVQRFLMDEKTGNLYGTLVLLDDKLSQRTESGEALLATLSSEEERVAAFEKHFYINLTMEERTAIGTPINCVVGK
jgi:arylamine N-acetyltransferase